MYIIHVLTVNSPLCYILFNSSAIYRTYWYVLFMKTAHINYFGLSKAPEPKYVER